MNYQIKKVAVLGAGVMGVGIAAHLANSGLQVLILDRLPDTLTETESKKNLTLVSEIVRNRYAIEGKTKIINPKNHALFLPELGSLIDVGNFEDDFHLISECDWVIEVIIENLIIKKALMKKISKEIKPNTIVTTNTSGISIDAIVEDMPKAFRENFMATHFFNPVRYMKLFELIACSDTNPELIEFMNDFGSKKLGKGVVMAKDTPGFIANRIGSFATGIILKLAMQYKFDIEKVDQLTGTIIGRPKSATFRTIDMVGLDVFSKVLKNIADHSSDDEEIKVMTPPSFVVDLINKGQLGNKTKKGFYKKISTSKGKAFFKWDYLKMEYIPVNGEITEAIRLAKKSNNPLSTIVFGEFEENKFVWEIVKNTLLYSAKVALDISDNFKAIDDAMKWGYNWTMGPFEIWDAIGFEKMIDKIKSEGDIIPSWIETRLAKGQMKFYDSKNTKRPYATIDSNENIIVKENDGASLVDIGDGVLCLTFKTKGNSVNESVVEMIEFAIEEVEKSYKGLVIGSHASNFSFGADLKMIHDLMIKEEWNSIEALVERLQSANMKLKYSLKPVVAAPYGMTLGAGAEIAMHTHKTVSNAELYMGLVEVGVGLIPAGGGTKELLFRAMDTIANASSSDKMSVLQKTFKKIAMAKVSSSAVDAVNKDFINKADSILMNSDYLIEESKKLVVHLDNGIQRQEPEKSIKVLGSKGRAYLYYIVEMMRGGGYISEYDSTIAKKVAWVLTGGDVLVDTELTETDILKLERKAFVDLCKEEKTLKRIEHMLKTGKHLRN